MGKIKLTKQQSDALHKRAESKMKNIGKAVSQIPKDITKFNGIMFVETAPNSEGIRNKKPLNDGIGKKIFNPTIEATGIKRENSIITYAIPYYSPDEKLIHKETIIEESKEIFFNMVEKYKPTVIVPLGTYAHDFVTTMGYDIRRVRGSIYGINIRGNRYKVIGTYSPYQLVKEYPLTVIAFKDFCKIKEESKFSEIKLPKRNYTINPTFEEAIEYMQDIYDNKRTVAYDIETEKSGEMNCFGFAISSFRSMCFPFVKDGYIPYWSNEQKQKIMELHNKILEDPEITIIVHNYGFEGYMLKRFYNVQIVNVYDTIVGSHVLNPELPNSLEFNTSIYTDEPYYKDEGGGVGRKNSQEEWDTHFIYNNKDCVVTYELYDIFTALIKEEGLEHIFKLEMTNAINAVKMTLKGIVIDTEWREIKLKEFEDKQEEHKQELIKLVGKEINPGSTDQIKILLYKDLALPKIYKRNHKNEQVLSTDVNALNELDRKFGNPEIKIIQKYRKAQTAKAFFKYKLDETWDNKARFSSNPSGQVGARWSTKKMLVPLIGRNFQNLPDYSRRQIIAPPGRLLYDIDLASAESYFVALYAKSDAQLKLFQEGKDFHIHNASRIFDRPEEECGKGTVFRMLGKIGGHSGNYGVEGNTFVKKVYELTAESLDEPVILTKKEGEEIIEGYHSLYPEIRDVFHESIKQEIRKTDSNGRYARKLTNFMGRIRYMWGRLNDKSTLNEAYNYKPQSGTSDIINTVINCIYSDEDCVADDVCVYIHTHDGLIGDIPENGYEKHLDKIASFFNIPLKINGYEVVIPIKIQVGKAWSDDFMETYIPNGGNNE